MNYLQTTVVSLILQCFLYGLTVATFRDCIYALLYDSAKHRRKATGDILWAMVASSAILSSLSTVEVVLYARSVVMQFADLTKGSDLLNSIKLVPMLVGVCIE